MKFKINLKIFENFRGLNVGVLIIKGTNNHGISEEIINQIRGEERRIRSDYNAETLSQNPMIGSWRGAYAVFGGKPKENKSSVENLYRLVLKGTELRHINKLVDVYNLISLKFMVPVGGEDTDKIKGDINLTFAGVNEMPVLLLGDKEPRPPHEGEVIYKDDVSTICRRWNWREADRTKLTEDTKNCVLVSEGLPPATREDLEKTMGALKELVQKGCGGESSYTVLNKEISEIDFSM